MAGVNNPEGGLLRVRRHTSTEARLAEVGQVRLGTLSFDFTQSLTKMTSHAHGRG